MATQLLTTEAVLSHHVRALVSGDLEDLMTDYTEASIAVGPDGALKGREAIRALFAGLLDTIFKPGTYELTVDAQHVEGEVAYLLWHARCSTLDVDFASDTFIIRQGKIVVQTFAPKMTPH